MSAVPVIDISRGRAEVAAAVARAVEEIGFLVVAGHGVPQATIDAIRTAARELFARSEAEKNAFADRAGTLNRGYTAFRSEFNGSTRTNRAPADLREGFIFGPFDLPDDPYYTASEAGFAYQDNIWPRGAAGTVGAFTAYYRALEALNVELLGIFADALGLQRGFFLDKFDRHASTVRVLHYPTQSEPPEDGQLRCGAHTDFGSHTILLADDSPGGLQVRGRAGGWIDVIPPADSFIVNIGDLMMTWTNDRWLSNLHRVANPPPGTERGSGRLSIAFFGASQLRRAHRMHRDLQAPRGGRVAPSRPGRRLPPPPGDDDHRGGRLTAVLRYTASRLLGMRRKKEIVPHPE